MRKKKKAAQRLQAPPLGAAPSVPQKKRGIIAFFRRQDWEDFTMKFLSVFLGIVITFAGNAWLSHSREKSDTRKTLSMVHDELLENIRMMNDAQQMVNLEDSASLYLMGYYDHFDQCHPDSMRHFCNAPLNNSSVRVSTDALELLKTTATLQKITDKNLALSIIRAYALLQEEQEAIDYYYQKKEKLINEAMQEKAKALFASQHFTAAEMWSAITSTTEGRQFLNEIHISAVFGFGHEENISQISEIVTQIEGYINQD